MEMLVNLIIQLVAGAIGGNAAGASMKSADLGKLYNSIVGAIGGIGGGQLLAMLVPAMNAAAAGGGMDVAAIVGQVVGGGVGGAILTAIVGVVRNMMAGPRTT